MKITSQIVKLLLLILLYCSWHVYADPPKFVYRIDTRSPEEIFKYGFSPVGNNMDLIRHVTGVDGSGFVSTSSNEAAVINGIAPFTIRTFSAASRNAWLYTIRATGDFYDVNTTLRTIEAEEDPHELINENRIENVLNRYNWQEEWVSTRSISPELIQTAQEVTLDRGSSTVRFTGNDSSNARYLDRDTTGNSNPYQHQGHISRNGRGFLNHAREFLGYFMICGKPHSSLPQTEKNLKIAPDCDHPNRLIFDNNYTAAANAILLSD